MNIIKISVVCALCVVASAVALPTSISNFRLLNNLRHNMEVIDGPREFLVPVAPLRYMLESNIETNGDKSDSRKSDLDYMVYGKFYLTKLLERSPVSDRAGFTSRSPEMGRIASTWLSDQRLQSGNYQDGIEFLANLQPPKTKRLYRFKVTENSNVDQADTNYSQQNGGALQPRKVEERSASNSAENAPENVSTTNLLTSSSSTEFPHDHDLDSGSDEEGAELIRNFQTLANARTVERENSSVSSDGVSESKPILNADSSTNVDDLVTRFLLDVPSKPNPTQTTKCPDGQRRIHRGICRPVYNHNTSPQDGVYRGKLTTTSATLSGKPSENTSSTSVGSATSNGNKNGNHPLTTVFKSLYLELEKKLQKSIQEAEKKFTHIVDDIDEGSSTTTPVSNAVGKS